MSKPSGGIVFVIDDDLSVREALRGLIASAGWHVETFATADAFLARARWDGPSCIVLDVRLPGLSGLELQRLLADTDRQTSIVFISGHGDVPTSVRAMKAGAVDFLLKPFDDGELLEAIERAIVRDNEARRDDADLQALRRRHDALTERQRQVMALVVRGMLNKQIADALGITLVTVKVHRGRAMRTMQATSVAELVRMADRLDLVG